MKVTEFTRDVLAARKERRDMERAGYKRVEVLHSQLVSDWYKAVTDVRIAHDKQHVWCKIEPTTTPVTNH